jgi:nucleoside-diphosphate-sugar epimerase
MPSVRLFFTGYTGFLGTELLPRLLRRAPDANAVCLVQPKFVALARERAKDLGDRVRIIEGDIIRLLRIPSPAVDYFVHPTTYDTTNADAALSGSGVFVPRLADYAATLVAFARAHPGIGSAAMA